MTQNTFNMDERYRIEARVGSGAMATVYKAYDMRLQRIVALKVLHEHLGTNAELRTRFEQEAKLAARIDHPNVVRIYDFGIDAQAQLVIVSEFIDGRSLTLALRQYSNRFQPYLHPILAALVGLEIAKGMEAAHRHSVIHRDLKPDNVLVHQNGEVKLTDFGVARPFDSSLTQAGQFIGSLTYASPEQVHGGKVDARSDLFSFGVILFELLTGQLPFRSSNPTDLAIKISQAAVPPLNQVRPSVPFELDTIVRKCLRASPQERPQSADQIVGDLLRYLSGQEIIPSSRAIADGFENPNLFASTIRRAPLFPVEEKHVSTATEPRSVSEPAMDLPSLEVLKQDSINSVQDRTPLTPAEPQPPARQAQESASQTAKEQRGQTQNTTHRRNSVGVKRAAQVQPRPLGKTSWLSPILTVLLLLGIFAFLVKEKGRLREMFSQMRDFRLSTQNEKPLDESSDPSSPNVMLTAMPSEFSQLPFEAPASAPTLTPSPDLQSPTPAPTTRPTQTATPSVKANAPMKPVGKTTPSATNNASKKNRPAKSSPKKATRPVKTPQRAQTTPAKAAPVRSVTPAQPSSTQLVIRTEPGEMSIFINGSFEGLSSRSGSARTFTIPAGNVLLKIPAQEHSGKKYQEFSRRFRVEPGKTIELPKITLTPADTDNTGNTGRKDQ